MDQFQFEFLTLTCDEQPDCADDDDEADQCVCFDDDVQLFVDDMMDIVPLVPEETRIDAGNHCCCASPCNLFFFKELGYFSDEPLPIDPEIDYEAEYLVRLEQQRERHAKNRGTRCSRRRHHIDFAEMPSLSHETSRHTGSSSSSSLAVQHQQQQQLQQQLYLDPCSPYRLGHTNTNTTSSLYLAGPAEPYHYGHAALEKQQPLLLSSSRLH
ncbi:hypothetical protein BC940DRAFT_289576 [Gongronella butleri]|nr:hypothetical protein BC940DRAFT_289576 [Gongronella butleri]